MRILIIEDNPLIAQALRVSLKDSFVIDICDKGQDGIYAASTTAYDTILLDLNLPDIGGEKVCSRLRNKGIKSPIIVLSGKGEIKSKIALLNMGADDYVVKPFNMQELRARIDVAMRRSTNSQGSVIEIEGIKLDSIARIVERFDESIHLRRKEFDLLEYLIRHKNQSVTRTMILEHIWDTNENLWANVVDVHIKHLRDKIDRPYGTKLIKTVHGVGYRFESTDNSAEIKEKRKVGAR